MNVTNYDNLIRNPIICQAGPNNGGTVSSADIVRQLSAMANEKFLGDKPSQAVLNRHSRTMRVFAGMAVEANELTEEEATKLLTGVSGAQSKTPAFSC